MEAVVSDWIGVLSGLPRLWEAGEVMPLITSPGEEHPHHTPLAGLVDAGNFRALVAQLQQSWQAAFAQAETFRQVIKPWALHTLGQLQITRSSFKIAYIGSLWLQASCLPSTSKHQLSY